MGTKKKRTETGEKVGTTTECVHLNDGGLMHFSIRLTGESYFSDCIKPCEEKPFQSVDDSKKF